MMFAPIDNSWASEMPSSIYNACIEACTTVGVGMPMAYMSALGALSVCAQGWLDVERMPRLRSPAILHLGIIAASGERKSSILKLFMQPIYESQKTGGCPQLLGDASPVSILETASDQPVAIVTDEGLELFDGASLDKLNILTQTWDGSKARYRRRGKLIELGDPITLLYAVQPKLLMQFLQAREGYYRVSGAAARVMFYWAPSEVGGRLLTPFNDGRVELQHIPKFHAMLGRLLQHGRCSRRSRRLLTLSPYAFASWRDFHNLVERRSAPLGDCRAITDFAAKMSDNVARVAALYHVAEGREGDKIEPDTMSQAILIGTRFLAHAVELFGPFGRLAPRRQELIQLEDYLFRRYLAQGVWYVPKNELRRNGPVRSTARLDELLNVLAIEQKLQVQLFPQGMFIHLAACLNRVCPKSALE